MKVILKKVWNRPRIIEVENTLEALQERVRGPIQIFDFAADACVICNEECRLRGWAAHTRIGGVEFGGPILIVGTRGETFTDVPRPELTMELLWPEMRKKRPTPARAGR